MQKIQPQKRITNQKQRFTLFMPYSPHRIQTQHHNPEKTESTQQITNPTEQVNTQQQKKARGKKEKKKKKENPLLF